MDSILQSLNQTLFPGHTVIRVDGYDAAEKYPMPRDCEAIMLDSDPDSNHLYMKKTDSNGGYIEDPVPKFDPDKYLSVDEFKKYQEENRKFQEEILDAINSIRQPANTGYSKSSANNK